MRHHCPPGAKLYVQYMVVKKDIILPIPTMTGHEHTANQRGQGGAHGKNTWRLRNRLKW